MKNVFSLIGKISKVELDNNNSIIFVLCENNNIIPITLPHTISTVFEHYKELNSPISIIGKIECKNNNLKLIATKISYVSNKL